MTTRVNPVCLNVIEASRKLGPVAGSHFFHDGSAVNRHRVNADTEIQSDLSVRVAIYD